MDTRDGHTKKIKGSGEVPEYCLRPDFGQMPSYLVKRNRRIQKALDRIRHAEETKESLCKLIKEEERQKLLAVSIVVDYCRNCNGKYILMCLIQYSPTTNSTTHLSQYASVMHRFSFHHMYNR